MKDTCRVAIAGCHRMLSQKAGGHNHAGGFAAVPAAKVVAVFDRGEDTRRQFVDCWSGVWGGLVPYDDYERMLDEAKPDILCVATRQTMHADQIEMAVEAGVKAILCEKPLATSMAEVDGIIAACRKVPLALALDRRWTTRYRALREYVASGKIGTVQTVLGFGAPNLINHGCHWYDTVLMLAGDPEPVRVSGMVDDLVQEPNDSSKRLDPPGRVEIELAGGVNMYLTPDGMSATSGLVFEVLGDVGRLLIFRDGNASFAHTDSPGSEPEADAPFLVPVAVPAESEGYPPIERMIGELIEGVRTGKRTSCDIDRARRATEIGFAVHASSSQGGKRVTLPLSDRSLRIESLKWGNE